MSYEEDKAKFLKVFSNLPLGLREDVIAVIKGKPVTWNALFVEIDQDTRNGKEILNKLKEMEII